MDFTFTVECSCCCSGGPLFQSVFTDCKIGLTGVTKKDVSDNHCFQDSDESENEALAQKMYKISLITYVNVCVFCLTPLVQNSNNTIRLELNY